MSRLRDVRTRAGLTARGLAEAAGVHENTVYAIESGVVRNPTPDVVHALASALGATPQDLTGQPYTTDQRDVPAMQHCLPWPVPDTPLPDEPEPGWRSDAACRNHEDAHLWFETTGRGGRPEEVVVETCTGCPVRPDCLRFALDSPEDHGVWGGFDEIARRRLRRPEGRGAA